MIGLGTVRLALAAIGLVTFGWGVRVDDQNLRLVGIVALLAASLLRFAKRKDPPGDPPPPETE